MNDKSALDQIAHNRAIHDRIADTYDECHVEIYNRTEQSRLHNALTGMLALVHPSARPPRVLDFGAGTGNVTRHLLDMGASVVAADVSPQSLARLERKLGHSDALETLVINGKDLAGVADSSFDLVVTYSVLHHVPDYLGAVEELLRVVRPGGMVCIDHEVCPSFWTADAAYLSYLGELDRERRDAHLRQLGFDAGPLILGRRLPDRLAKVFSLKAWRRLLARKLGVVPEHSDEGDIHVTLADHIDWEAIAHLLLPHCSEVLHNDYLVCRERDVPPVVWTRWSGHCVDMRMLGARKR